MKLFCLTITSFFLFLLSAADTQAACSQTSQYPPHAHAYPSRTDPLLVSFYSWDSDYSKKHEFRVIYNNQYNGFVADYHWNFTLRLYSGIWKIYVRDLDPCGRIVGPPILFKFYEIY